MHDTHADTSQQPSRTRSRSRLHASGKLLRPTLGLLVAAAALAGGWWQYQAHQRATNPGDVGASATGTHRTGMGMGGGRQPVSVAQVRRQDLHITANAVGTIAAANTAIVHVQVAGTLQSIYFREGQQVRAGQVLAQLDPRSFDAQVAQAEGTLARDQAQLDNARLDLTRYQDLIRKDAVPKQQLDTQDALVRQLEGTVKLDRGVLDSARLQRSYTRVEAPISGRAGLKQTDLGNVAQPTDANGIVIITQTRPAALTFSVPAALLPQIVAKLNAHQPLPVVAFDKDGVTKLATGHVDSIDNAIDLTTDTIKIKALFANKDDSLFPNQSVSVRLELDTAKNALSVPVAAILRGSQGSYVYLVNDDNTVTTRVIQPGATDGDWVTINSGALEPGQTIVVDGVDRLRNGAKVEVIRAGQSNHSGADGHSHAQGAAASTAASAANSTASGPGGDADAQRHAFFQQLTPEEREQFKALSPEQKKAWRESGHPPAAQ